MTTIELLLLLVGTVYGGLTIIAGFLQIKQRNINLRASILMVIGGVLITTAIMTNTFLSMNNLYLLIPGLFLIHLTAIDNGIKMHGKLNYRHHFVRSCISLGIILLTLSQ